GPNHVMTVLNSEIRIQSKTGAVISTMTLNAFWAGVEPAGGGGVFDPKVLYDQINGRWIFTAVSDAQSANSAFLIAATPGNDPTAVWNRFAVDYDSTDVNWGDYPSFGFNKDLVAVNLNSFTISGNSFTGTRTFILRKSTLYAAVPTITGTTFNNGTAFGFTIVPAITHDNALATLYFLADRTAAGFPGQLQLYTATTTGAAETFTASAITPTGTAWNFNSPTDFALQSGVARGIMNNDSRIQNVVYRNGSLWTAHTAFFPTGTPTRSTVQWWQINPASNTPVQLGRVEDTTPPNLGGTAVIFYAFPSIAVNQNSSVLIGYSRFSSLQFASANYSFRSAGDPLNTMRDDTVLKAGEDCYNKDFGGGRNRWGDYSSTVIDPSDDSSFWTIQEYAAPRVGALCTTANSGRWATWWGKILAPTAALTPVGGRVMTAHKRSINGVRLTFTNQQGIGRTVRTNPAGYYRLDDLAAGETYIVSLYHKSYRFETQVFSLNEELTEFNFVALP
ncbi:MAG: carboxypeptidase-like regulatory domain-containing protein, partial [Pyrinomonadaceae bacterium]|nr:carboxypeptidase-like regulatory domain-containing protein [Pyrinomonadaceae bacterium]